MQEYLSPNPASADPVLPSPDIAGMMSLSEALAAIPDDAFARKPVESLADAGTSRMLALDVLETPDVFEIHASVPGIDPAALDITVLGESVRIAAEARTADTPFVTEESEYRWLVRERPVGRADRTVSLPSPVDPDGADATIRDGVLIVTLPKVERARSVRIVVRGEAVESVALPDVERAGVIDLAPRF